MGDGGRYAYFGALAMVLMLFTVVEVSSAPTDDKWSGTFARLLISGRSLFGIYLVRSAPVLASGLVGLVAAATLTALVTGQGSALGVVAHTLPLYVLVGCSSTCAGLAVAATAIGRRADVIVSNGFLYLVSVCAGLLVPLESLPVVLDVVGSVLPTRHGVQAIRAVADGDAWGAQATLELAVGLGWAGLGVLLYRLQGRRARAAGSSDLT